MLNLMEWVIDFKLNLVKRNSDKLDQVGVDVTGRDYGKACRQERVYAGNKVIQDLWWLKR